MSKYDPVQYIEQFHLLFLEQLGNKVDKSLYVLKGGCNLRFFLKSIRYSQDIDFDVHTIRVETLQNAVHKILESTPFSLILRAKGIEILKFSEPKQTTTTQRWKLSLKVPNLSFALNTKIEFSRRKKDDEMIFESIDPLIAQKYQITPIFSNHYTAQVAFQQKIEALIGRNETQARDVFDLFHLIRMGLNPSDMSQPTHLERAKHNAQSLSFDDFKGQVLAYLPYEQQTQYDSPRMWESIVKEVVGSFD